MIYENQSIKALIQDDQITNQSNFLNSFKAQNPYSHLLCLRLLKDTFTKVDYAFLSLFQSQLQKVIFNISIFDSLNQDQERGRNIYLQGVSSSTIQSSLAMSVPQLQLLGFSVHKLSLQTLITLGKVNFNLPYHPSKTNKTQSEQKNQLGLTQRAMTPRATVNNTFTNQFQRQKMKDIYEKFQQYSFDLTQSISSKYYKKTNEMRIKYPQKLHYFKQKQIQKLKKDIQFNSEQKQYHVLKFYQFLLGAVLKEQMLPFQKFIQDVMTQNKKINDGEFKSVKETSKDNGFLQILKNIICSNDRYSIYFTIIYLGKAIKMITQLEQEKHKNKYFYLALFRSVCRIIDYLLISFTSSQKTSLNDQKSSHMKVSYFNLQLYLALDQVLSIFLVNAYLTLFSFSLNTLTQEQLKIYEYMQMKFIHQLIRWNNLKEKLKNQINLNLNLAESFKDNFIQYCQSTNNNIKTYSQAILKHYNTQNNDKSSFQDKIQEYCINVQKKYGYKPFKNNYFMNKIQIEKSCIQSIQHQIQFIDQMNIIQFAIQKSKAIFKYDNRSRNAQELSDLLVKNVSLYQVFSKKSISNTDKIRQNITGKKDQKIKDKSTKNKNFQTQQQIPQETDLKPRSMQKYKFQMNSNDISKIKFNQQNKIIPFVSKSNNKFSFTQNIKQRDNSISRLNLINREYQTILALSKRKYKRKHTHSRINRIDLSNNIQAMSCPTYSQVSSQQDQSDLATYRNLISEKKIIDIFEEQKVKTLQNQLKDSKRTQQKLMEMVKNQNQIIRKLTNKQGLINDNHNQNPKQKGNYLLQTNPSSREQYKIRIRDSISKQGHQIMVPQAQLRQNMKQSTHNYGNQQQQNSNLQIKDTDSYQLNYHKGGGNTNRVKNKSRFNEADEEGSLIINKMNMNKIRHQEDQTYSQIERREALHERQQSPFKVQRLNLNEKFFKSPSTHKKQASISDFHKTKSKSQSKVLQQQQGHWSTKFKKDILKKKILISKDSIIQIGMITNIQKVISSKKSINNLTQQKLSKQKPSKQQQQIPTKYSQYKLKSSIYVTPLVDCQRIEFNIQCPEWIHCDMSSNKTKQNIKADCQYILNVQFWLKNIQKHLFNLPELKLSIKTSQIKQQQQNYKLNENQKIYSFLLPVFITKFYTQQAIDDKEYQKLKQMIQSKQLQWTGVGSKLVKDSTELDKYFVKLRTFKQIQRQENLLIQKFIFLGSQVYLCFRNTHLQKNPQQLQKKKQLFSHFAPSFQTKSPNFKATSISKLSQFSGIQKSELNKDTNILSFTLLSKNQIFKNHKNLKEYDLQVDQVIIQSIHSLLIN